MGFSTDFVGHIDIAPPLNEAETQYLLAFSGSRRYDRGDPYDVPGNPLAETRLGVPMERYNAPSAGQPNLWCDWEVCWDGCCITWSGKEKSYSMEPWLRYVIDHFLRPGAVASKDPRFEDFTFDHVLNGIVVGCRRDTKELFTLEAADNVVSRSVIRTADPRYLDYPPLAYEEEIDREATVLRRRRRPLPEEEAEVVRLADRQV
ncbi:hypothetical protein [Nocardioides currus]|uniref:Uncharacterized protein n=1 Tax=Nocardioides currus TaxID=2133958 RepID=A0A2R7Z2H9_9ACTN|nr:hypothetical protein [Nocardioides currus]PUA82446.1 hypothetical protein C7S10_01455 [Nocardioides currus]